MTKEELIHITLKQLIESFKVSPECFQTEACDSSGRTPIGPMILWRFRVELEGNNIPDPNNPSKTILVVYNEMAKTLTCNIFLRDVPDFNKAIMADGDATIHLTFPFLNRSYREFKDLRKRILRRKLELKGMEYLNKLRSIFPTTHDDDLLS
jgi:hypothetical protein